MSDARGMCTWWGQAGRRSGSIAGLLAVWWIPLAASAAQPRFQSFGIGDYSDSRAIAVSDDGCVVVGTGGPATEPTHFRFEHGVIRPLADLLGGESIGSVEGISGDGRVVVGGSDSADRAYSLEAGAMSTFWFGYETALPDRARAISGDGALIAGDHRYGIKTKLWDRISGVPRAELLGTVVALSQDGGVAAGRYGSAAYAWTGTTPRDLGSLPGQLPSSGLGVSADGSTVVGGSGARAFRWRDGSMEDLGAGVALAASADGSIVLGDSFLWDATHGRRDLRAAIEADFGVDLARWERVIGADLSPDGHTIVGAAARPGQPLRAFRARRGSEACPAPPVPEILPLILREREYLAGPSQLLSGPAVGPDGTVYIRADYARPNGRGGYDDYQRVIRTRVRDDPDAPWRVDVVLDVEAEDDWLWVAGVGTGGEGYVGTRSEKLLRVEPDGSVTELLDGSVYPKPIVIQWEEYGDDYREVEYPVPTQVHQVATAPDGTLFAAAGARALRIDPDGSATELFDVAEMQAWVDRPGFVYAGQPFWVQRFPDGRLAWGDGYGVAITDPDGNLLELLPGQAGRRFQVTDEGGLWSIASWGPLTYFGPDGVLEEFYPVSPDGTAWNTWAHWLGLAADGSLFFVAEPDLPGSPPRQLVRWTPGEGVTPIHPADWGTSFALTGDTLLVADRFVADRFDLTQIRTDPVSHACRNGRDDDGDALVDLADPGCSGPLDPSERSDELPCDDGLDNDGDGLADLHDDPGCAGRTAATESPECDDGVDNDGDGRIDWNGGGVGAPDAHCGDNPSAASEGPACGLGFELALLAPIARRMRRRQGRIAPAVLSGIPR